MNSNPDYRFVGVASADGSSIKYLEPLGDTPNDFKVDWSPSGQMVATFNKGVSGQTSRLFFVGQNDENFKAIDLQGYGVETKWVPDGQILLYSAHNGDTQHKPMLYIVDAVGANAGANHQSLGLNTWPDKCSFSGSNTLYCAVPKELPYGADYAPAVADQTPDYIYKVDLTTGGKTFIAEPDVDYTIEQMVVSEDGSSLFFTDKATKAVHSIKLK